METCAYYQGYELDSDKNQIRTDALERTIANGSHAVTEFSWYRFRIASRLPWPCVWIQQDQLVASPLEARFEEQSARWHCPAWPDSGRDLRLAGRKGEGILVWYESCRARVLASATPTIFRGSKERNSFLER